MNIKETIEKWDEQSKAEALQILRDWETQTEREKVKDLVLTKEEEEMIQQEKYVEAIKHIRNRIGCTLSEAKTRADLYRNNKTAEASTTTTIPSKLTHDSKRNP